jgi:hypothetical protein
MDKIKQIEAVVSVDGIELDITYENGEEIQVFIYHDRFRAWSFNAGYWTDAYYKFLEKAASIEKIWRQYLKDYPVLEPEMEEA